MNILFTCAGRRNYLIKYFKNELNGKGVVYAADMSDNASALAEADEAFTLPGVSEPDYFDKLFQASKEKNIDVIISLNDLELPLLAAKKEMLARENITAVISDTQVIETCFDKFKTNTFASEMGIRVPETYTDMEKLMNDLKTGAITFPLVLKPRRGSASEGIKYVNNEEELNFANKWLQYEHKRKQSAKSEVNPGYNAILIQQKLEGTEYGLDVINDLKGNHIAVIVKKKIDMRAGETDKAVTVDNPELAQIGRRIGTELRHIGNLDCDFFEVDGEYYLLEMNPRFGGGYPFSHEAGVNLPKAMISWLKGEKAPSSCFKYGLNKLFAKCDRLILISK